MTSLGSARWTVPALARAALVAIVALALAWQVVRIQVAQRLLKGGHSLAALRFDGGSGDALAAAAASSLARGDAANAERFARASLARAPLSARAVRSLALARQAQGDVAVAGPLMGQAAALGWRDGPAQLWLAAVAYQNRDYRGAAQHLDALARIEGLTGRVQQLLDLLLDDPAMLPPLAERLAARPAWRSALFLDRARLAPERLARRAVALRALVGTPSPPTDEETRSVVDRLIYEAHDYPAARRLWLATLMGRHAASADSLGFDRLRDQHAPTLFDWALVPAAGAIVTAEPQGSARAVALKIQSDGSAAGTIARRTLMLAPGRHGFDFRAETNGATASDAFRWSLTCTPASRPRFWSEPVGTSGLQRMIAQIPAGGCAAQVLELQLRSGSAAIPLEIMAEAPAPTGGAPR